MASSHSYHFDENYFTVEEIQDLFKMPYRDALSLFKFGILPKVRKFGVNYLVPRIAFFDWLKLNNHIKVDIDLWISQLMKSEKSLLN